MMLPAAAQTKQNPQVDISASFKEVRQRPRGYTDIINIEADEVKKSKQIK